MSRNYNHSPRAEIIANQVRLGLFVVMIAIFSLFAMNMNNGQSEQTKQQNNIEDFEKGEYEATLTVSTTNGKVTLPVTFVVENDGELGTVNFNTNEKVENE